MNNGYGTLFKHTLAHRYFYEIFVGTIEKGKDLDHLYRNRGCVNPKHLEPVSRRENVIRGLLPGISRANNLAKKNCPKGHPYYGENLYVAKNGSRGCKICRYEAHKRYKIKKNR